MFVKCIYSEQAEPYLKEGVVYKVLDEREDSYMVDANTNYWNKGRFEIIEECMKELTGRDVIDNTLDTALLGYNISGLLVDIQDHPLLFGVKNKTIKLTINLEENNIE